jgi:hypothetical protein
LRQPEPDQRVVHGAEAGLDTVRVAQPVPQLVQRQIRPAPHLGRDHRVQRHQLEALPAALRPRRGLAPVTTPRQRFVDVRDADLEQLSDLVGPAAFVDRLENPHAKILRVSLTAAPHPSPLG